MRSLVTLALASIVLVSSSTTFAANPTTRQAANATAKATLSRKVPDARLINITLVEALDYVRDVSGANIHVNWRALEPLGVTKDTTVNVRMRDVPLRRVLRALLDETGIGESITYYVDEGVVEVTTREISDAQMITRVYPIDDLVMYVPDFAGPSFDLSQQQNTASGGGGGGGGGGSGGSLFGNNASNQQNPESQQSKTERANDLVKLVVDTVRPEIWRDNGGTAAIRYFNGHLIVTAPRSVHEAISGYSD